LSGHLSTLRCTSFPLIGRSIREANTDTNALRQTAGNILACTNRFCLRTWNLRNGLNPI
jgi:hypothetical protein